MNVSREVATLQAMIDTLIYDYCTGDNDGDISEARADLRILIAKRNNLIHSVDPEAIL